jgi:hypothetical protein
MNYQKMRDELTSYYLDVADARSEFFCDECLAELDSLYREDMSVFEMKKLLND